MTLIESRNAGIIIDCGILFPRDGYLGVRHLHPNFYPLLTDKFDSLFLTHSHEDHIGAVSQLLKFRPNLKIYCSRFCFEILKSKLKKDIENFQILNHKDSVEIDGLKITALGIDHSTPQTFAFYIEKDNAGAFFSSDFKINPSSRLAIEALKELRPNFESKRILCGFLDSTSIQDPGHTLTEQEVSIDLKEVLKAPKRITVTCFASNVQRMKSIIETAKELGKNVYLYGRSIHFYFSSAVSSGLIKNSSHVFDIDQYSKGDQYPIIIVSGCQGDYRSTLTNLSKGQGGHYQVSRDDLIVFSSSVIPGNAKQLQGLYNNFIELGADIITNKDFKIHCSGHPGQKDIAFLSSLIPFTHYHPIHGESFLLKKHYHFSRNELGLNSYLLKDFQRVTIKRDYSHKITDELDPNSNPLIIRADNGSEITKDVIKMRRKLATNGLAIVDTLRSQIFEYATNISEKSLTQIEKKTFQFLRKNSPSKEELRIYTRSLFAKEVREKIIVIVH